mgnify:CR=1 FL=1
MEKGLFITFEGGEGAGKSTQCRRLKSTLEEAGHDVVLTREPGGTPESEKIRDLLVQRDGGNWTPMAECLLFFAARQMHVEKLIKPALSAGKIVICDRFTDSSFAYQGGGRQFNTTILQTLEQWVQEIAPDLTLWFDLPASVAAARLATSRTPDKFEAESQSFFERVVEGYRQRADAHPQRIVRIGADQSVEAVWQQVQDCVLQRLEAFNVGR